MVPVLTLNELQAVVDRIPTTVLSVAAKADVINLATAILGGEMPTPEHYQARWSLFVALLPTLR